MSYRPSDSAAYSDGLRDAANDNVNSFRKGSDPSYQEGISAAENGKAAGAVAGGLLAIGLAVGFWVVRIVTVYSPFIFLGLLVQYPLGLYRRAVFHNLEEYAINGAVLALLSYGWFCLFQAWRGIMLTARRKGIKSWRLHYVASLLLTTVFPVVTITFIAWADKTLALFSPLICAIVLLKAYRHYDLLNEEKIPAVAKWSYQIGKAYAESRWTAISRPELAAPLNHQQCLLSFLIVWGAVAYCCSYTVFLVMVVLLHSVTIGMLVGFVVGGVGALLFVTHFSKTIYEYEITQSLSSKSIGRVLFCIYAPLVVCSLLLPNHSYPLTWAEEPLDCLALALALPLSFGLGIYTALRRLGQYQPLDTAASH